MSVKDGVRGLHVSQLLHMWIEYEDCLGPSVNLRHTRNGPLAIFVEPLICRNAEGVEPEINGLLGLQ